MKRGLVFILLVLTLCLTGCMTSTSLRLDSWQDFRKEMLDKYDCISRLEGAQYYPWLEINICYSGDTLPESTREAILDDFHAFLSSDVFLDEYVPHALEQVSEAEAYVDPPMPDINIEFLRQGSDTREYQSSASYYTGSYRSDQKMKVDNYQTWHGWDRAAQS